MTKNLTLRPLLQGEMYVVLDEASRKDWVAHRPPPAMHNTFVVSMIFEPLNATVNVLVFYAIGERLRLVPRSYVQKYDVGTGKLSPAWETTTTGTM